MAFGFLFERDQCLPHCREPIKGILDLHKP